MEISKQAVEAAYQRHAKNYDSAKKLYQLVGLHMQEYRACTVELLRLKHENSRKFRNFVSPEFRISKLKHDFKHTIVVKPKPAQKSIEHWWQFQHIVCLLYQADEEPSGEC